MEHRIVPNQIYRSCKPTFVINGEEIYTRIKVTHYPINTVGLFGYGKVQIVTLTDSGREVRRRAIECSELHDTKFTLAGAERRTGYYLETDVS